MLLFPYNTDAPIYHLPIATGTLIVVNVVVFFTTTFQLILGNVEPESVEWLILHFDQINPLQWLTASFMHGDLMHLLGNMLFLWAFGLVVEGKLGSPRFLLLYLVLTLLDGALVQWPMFVLGGEGAALGASGVIFALMAIAMIWAPENEMDCFYWVFWYAGTFEVRIVKLGAMFVMLQLLFLWLGGFSMSSEMLHMIGIAVGAPVGFYMLRQDMIDCEGWDLVSRNEFLQQSRWLCSDRQRLRLRQKEADHYDPVASALAGQHSAIVSTYAAARAGTLRQRPTPATPPVDRLGKKSSGAVELGKRLRRKKASAAERPDDDAAGRASAHPEFNRLAFLFRQAIANGDVAGAEHAFAQLEQRKISAGLSHQTLVNFAQLLGQSKRYAAAIRPLQLIVSRGGTPANEALLRIARIQLKVLRDPDEAQATLQRIELPTPPVSDAERKVLAARDELLKLAQR